MKYVITLLKPENIVNIYTQNVMGQNYPFSGTNSWFDLMVINLKTIFILKLFWQKNVDMMWPQVQYITNNMENGKTCFFCNCSSISLIIVERDTHPSLSFSS